MWEQASGWGSKPVRGGTGRELVRCLQGRGAHAQGWVLLLSSSSSRFCGERSPFVVASRSNRVTVHFHSDQSYTDTGFLAEYQSYDSSDRE